MNKRTAAEQTFISRMADEIVRAGGKMSMEDAARAVLARDEKLWLAAMATNERGEAIRSEMARTAYDKIKAAA